MKNIYIQPIVEGHGEVVAVPGLLRRIWYELVRSEQPLIVLPPIRRPRSQLVQALELQRAVKLASLKLRQQHIRAARYSETADQPKLTHSMDLMMTRDRSPSFDKLCREIESLAR